MVVSGIACLLGPAGVLLIAWGVIQGGRRGRGTTRSRGRILRSEVHGGTGARGEAPSVRLWFEYWVGGERLEAQQEVRSWLFQIGANAVSFLDRFRPGREVTVRFDPAQPGNAEVDLGWTWSGAPLVAVGLALVFFALAPTIPGALWVRAFFGVWILIALWMVAFGALDIRRARRIRGWRMGYGTVTASQVHRAESGDDAGPIWWPEVRYEYEAGGQRFHGRQMQMTPAVLSGSQRAAQKAAARYPVGKHIRVFYEPNNPANAVLQTGTSRGWLLLVAGAAILLMAALALLVYLIV